MKYLFGLFLVCWCAPALAQEEEYVVNVDSMNAAIDLVADASAQVQNRNYEEAIRLCEVAIRKAVTFRDAYIVRHQAYEGHGSEAELMIANLMAAQKISLEDEELSYYLGNVYQNTKKLKEAVAAYSDAIKYSNVNPDDSPIRYSYFFNRGNCYLKQRKYAEAIPDYTKTLELSPGHVGSYVNRGFSYFNTKDNDNACKDWKTAEAKGNQQVGKFIKQYCK